MPLSANTIANLQTYAYKTRAEIIVNLLRYCDENISHYILLNLMHYNHTNDLGWAYVILNISNHKWYLFTDLILPGAQI